jgi:hypothetical protein
MVFTVFSDQLAVVSSEELHATIGSLMQDAGAEQGKESVKKSTHEGKHREK